MQTWFVVSATLALLTTSAVGFGQTAPPPADTARSYRHHLGLTASPQLDHFFTANQSLPIGLLYRQQTRPNRAWRARVVGRYQFNSGDAPLLIGNSYREHTASVELAWGKERWLPLSRRLTAYAGGEVGAQLEWYRKSSEYYRLLPRYNPGFPAIIENAITDQLEKQTTESVFFQFVTGIRFNLNRRLGIEAEAGFPIGFSRRKWRLDATEYFLRDREPTGASNIGDNTYYTLSAQFRPINRLHLLFLF